MTLAPALKMLLLLDLIKTSNENLFRPSSEMGLLSMANLKYIDSSLVRRQGHREAFEFIARFSSRDIHVQMRLIRVMSL